jgi:hypothetical protein
MRRVLIAGFGVVILLLVLSQLFLPLYLEGRVEDRLTKNGGKADVTLKALPAFTLLAGSGSEAKVTGSGLSFDLNETPNKPLDGLDGFDKVNMDVTDSTAGPFQVSHLTLERGTSGDPYAMSLDATATGHDLAAFAGGQLAGPLGGFLGGLASGALPATNTPIPVTVDATMKSDGGDPKVESVNGTIAGLPAGPLLEAVVQALAQRF